MDTDKTEQRKMAKALKHARARRLGLIEKVAKSRAKFEKRCRKLQDVESKIAELMQRTYQPDAHSSDAQALHEVEAQAPATVIPAHANGDGNAAGQPL